MKQIKITRIFLNFLQPTRIIIIFFVLHCITAKEAWMPAGALPDPPPLPFCWISEKIIVIIASNGSKQLGACCLQWAIWTESLGSRNFLHRCHYINQHWTHTKGLSSPLEVWQSVSIRGSDALVWMEMMLGRFWALNWMEIFYYISLNEIEVSVRWRQHCVTGVRPIYMWSRYRHFYINQLSKSTLKQQFLPLQQKFRLFFFNSLQNYLIT